ncbi:hypothetical protein GALL_490040 [mine drainage metagenome]|uniref:Uncharacterized protein n=1 Tax=mine drainage metagenome TaxID=410659 RepID=A0A1J5PVT7_9ZZZZ
MNRRTVFFRHLGYVFYMLGDFVAGSFLFIYRGGDILYSFICLKYRLSRLHQHRFHAFQAVLAGLE